MSHTKLNVAVIGASDDPDRYSHKAIRLLQEHGHAVFPVTPKLVILPGLEVFSSVTDIPEPLDTITLYVNPRVLESLASSILKSKPRRVIFNPGTEHPELQSALEAAGIEVEEACTLVLLNTGQFA